MTSPRFGTALRGLTFLFLVLLATLPAGLLAAPRAREIVRTFTGGSLDAARARVAAEVRDLVGTASNVTTAVDCRYPGQSHELTVASVEEFPAEHERRNGHSRPGAPIEVVAVRARAVATAPCSLADLPAVERRRVTGPAVVGEPDCTVWIPGGWTAEPGSLGAWVLRRSP